MTRAVDHADLRLFAGERPPSPSAGFRGGCRERVRRGRHVGQAVPMIGLMPAVDLDADTLVAIAGLIHDSDLPLPDGYEEHRRAQHGPRAGAASGARHPTDTHEP